MMNLKGIVLAIALLLSSASQARSYQASLTLSVVDAEKTMDRIVKTIEASGGYFTRRTDKYLHVKIPNNKFLKIVDRLSNEGEVIGKSISSNDLKSSNVQMRASLVTKEQMLKKYFKTLSQAKNRNDIIYLQAEINRMIAQIENLKLNLRRNALFDRYAQLRINFSSKDVATLSTKKSSDFGWLNSLGINQLMGNF